MIADRYIADRYTVGQVANRLPAKQSIHQTECQETYKKVVNYLNL